MKLFSAMMGVLSMEGALNPTAAIKTLFTNGELGSFTIPADFNQAYQAYPGELKNTAVGQFCGLLLDTKTELASVPIINDDFSNLSNWFYNGGWTYTGGLAVHAGAFSSLLNFNIATSTFYQVEITVAAVSGGITYLHLADLSSKTPDYSTVGTHTIVMRSGPTLTQGLSLNGTGNISLDNLKVTARPGFHAYQTNNALRPKLAQLGTSIYLDFTGAGVKLTTTFPNLGSNVTIARAIPGVGAVILTGQTIGAGSWDSTTNNAGELVINRGLTAGETAIVVEVLNVLAGVEIL